MIYGVPLFFLVHFADHVVSDRVKLALSPRLQRPFFLVIGYFFFLEDNVNHCAFLTVRVALRSWS